MAGAAWGTLGVLAVTAAGASVADLRRRVIPNSLLGAAALALGLLAVATGQVEGGLLGAAALSLVAFLGVTTGGLGMGDLKYLAVVGLGLGPLVGLLALLLAALGAVLWHLPLACRRGVRASFAFGPCIALGSVVAPLLWGVISR